MHMANYIQRLAQHVKVRQRFDLHGLYVTFSWFHGKEVGYNFYDCLCNWGLEAANQRMTHWLNIEKL
ncbi:hypothetical protein SLEP1_g586 [Rubroshorea leprosula]|uniref:Uncharacterized protein n=1 Tax=Rubroshorea leprosula TaxID=152421 RepID=A0AAV5HJR0_9ROSI|nr:hypothetical protein SLEP1_g586 [Rubroshorea leprosula]